ncbi:MAG: hypothetical protein JWN14_3053 [Chthonomonadales bacterium]|nr:hypothetical protein [Chthonomonadales bacterium]
MASPRPIVPTSVRSRPLFSGVVSLLVRMARLKKAAPSEPVPATSEDTAEADAPQANIGGPMENAERIFGIDVRSLALFRICLALMMIGDLLYRAQDLQAHYTDAGVVPIAIASLYQQQHWWWSIHNMHPALAVEVVLFLIAGLFALSLLVGYRTRMASVVCWLLLISLQNRNVLVLTGGDTMLRVMAFWAMFLPLGVRWSVDRALDKTDAPMPKRIFSVGSVALIAQIAMVYLFGAMLKTGPSWRTDYTAIYYSLSIGQFATPLAKFLLHYPNILKPLTFFSWNLELFAPFLIVASAYSGRLRTFIVLVYMGFHIMLGQCLELGLFPTIGALTWLVLMPDWFWQKCFQVAARLPKRKTPEFVAGLAARWAVWREALHPQSVSTRMSRAGQCLALFYLVYVVCWNVRTLNFTQHVRWFSQSWNWVGEIARMDQSWELFAPDPMKSEGWLVVEAELQDGEKVDLKNPNTTLSYAPPPLISTTYYNERWRKYLMNIADSYPKECFVYASYLGNLWNTTHPSEQRVTKVTINLMRTLTTLPNEPRAKVETIKLFEGQFTPESH